MKVMDKNVFSGFQRLTVGMMPEEKGNKTDSSAADEVQRQIRRMGDLENRLSEIASGQSETVIDLAWRAKRSLSLPRV